MAFTGTISANTNLIINTSSLNIYLFKEPNVNFSIEKITKKIKNNKGELFEVNQDIFETGFANKQLNNFFGVEKVKTENSLDFLDGESNNMTTVTQLQIYPTAVSSSLIDTRRRRDFIFESWKDDPYQTSSQGFTFNLLRSREANTLNLKGFVTPFLSSSRDSYSVWPLDFFTITDRPGNETVAGELLWTPTGRGGLFSNKQYTPIAAYVANSQLGYTSSLPWVAPYFANSKPFQDSELKFSALTSKKYVNYSIVPEYNLSSKITHENFENIESIAFTQSFDLYCTGSDYISPLTDAILLTGTLKFDIRSVLQVRPYREFYPLFATLKAASIFSQTLTQSELMNQSYFGTSLVNMVAATIPYFGPGILYNSIKAGIPMQFVGGQVPNGYLIIPFNSIFNPLADLLNKNLGGGLELTQTLNTVRYQNFILNFLNEVKNTFCKNNNLEYFSSIKEEDFQVFNSGTNYLMDLSLNVGAVNRDSNTNFNWIGGVNYIGYNSFSTSGSFPNLPPYFQSPDPGNTTYNGLSTVRISFTPTLTRKYTIDEIIALSSVEFRISKSLTGTLPLQAYYPKLTSSFDIFQKETNNDGATYWKIKSKWEFPFLALSGTIFTYSAGNFRKNDSLSRANTQGWIAGLWHDFCEVPTSDQGLFLQLSDVNYITSSVSSISASLASMVGFPNQTKRVGELNSFKNVKELLCIVPYKVSDNSLFDISPSSTLAQQNYRNFAKYIVPPKLDHHKDGVTSKIAFCVEITDQWSKRDLSYVWQNLLPQNGLNHKEFNTIYTVDAESQNLLQNQNVKFMIFKCKERSSVNSSGTWSGYNWPYDFFSLCELCKVNIIQEV